MLTHFDFADLRLFICIAQENSLTRGAERVHMSLPAASTRIKNLEESLGAKLLYRASNGVTLTPPGQVLLQHALDVQRQMEHLCSDLQEYAQGVKGHVRLFANTTAITEFLPGVLSRFLASHRNVNVDLRERLSPIIVRAVTDGAADIGIVAGNVRSEGLEVLPYREDRLILVCARGHALGQQSRGQLRGDAGFRSCLPAGGERDSLVPGGGRGPREPAPQAAHPGRQFRGDVPPGRKPMSASAFCLNWRRAGRPRRATSIWFISPTNGRCAISRSACAASICCRASRATSSR